MVELDPTKRVWRHSRYGLATFFFATLVVALTILRIIIYAQFGTEAEVSAGVVIKAFFIGLHQDIIMSLITTLPLLAWLWIVKERAFPKRWHRIALTLGLFLFWSVQCFIFFTEYFFFEEFRSRFNTVAVDYLIYPHEVVGNIRDSYPLYTIIAICLCLGAAWVIGAMIWFKPMWHNSIPARGRSLRLAGAAGVVAILLFTIDLQGTRFSEDRTINEVANNGSLSFVHAAWTRNLEYEAHYRTLPREEAYARVRNLLQSPNAEFVGDEYSIRRNMAGDPSRPRLNVVLILEESLGSEFFGSLGRKQTLTPEMDKLMTEEGLMFSNIYASGNRTVRGFEGVFSSFPPLPGDSIVRRDRSENVESIARVLKRDGYDTLFLYGGRGILDGMRSYAVRNGWDRFIEQKDFKDPVFTTIWGVSDEDLFARSIEEFRKLHATGKPFLGTVLTVSNHKPYTYPRGRIPEDPELPKPNRRKVVKYTDWCLGKFFRDAKKEAFWTNTVFVVVADHGARVYGAQEVPIFSYEIPFAIFGPAVVKEPRRIHALGNSLDVAPTILGILGRPYESIFFGRDLLNDPPATERALLNHNRSIGMYADARMAILSLQKSIRFYEGDAKLVELQPVAGNTPEFQELEKNATALFQVADDLYMNRRFRIDETAVPVQPDRTETRTLARQ